MEGVAKVPNVVKRLLARVVPRVSSRGDIRSGIQPIGELASSDDLIWVDGVLLKGINDH